MTRLILLLALAACDAFTKANPNYRPPGSPDAASPTLAPGEPQLRALQLDLAACRPPDGPSRPTYDGDLWRFGPASASLRCSIQFEAGDVVRQWTLFGRHDTVGTQTVTACLQRLETVLTAESSRHLVVGECDAAPASFAREFSTSFPHAAPTPCDYAVPRCPRGQVCVDGACGWTTSEDDVLSLLVTGDGGAVGAATVYVVRQ